jgi:ACS family hexuronate transporter-like MFS transporter
MPLPTNRAWLLCILLSVATALSFLDRQVLSVLAPQITSEFGMSNTVYSRVLFAFVLSYTVMATLGGRLIDALGTRLGIALAVGFWSLASAMHAFVTGAWSLAIARFGLGVGEGPCFPAAIKGAVEWVPAKHRAFAIGLAISGSAFGAVVAPPVAAWLAGWIGWRGAFLAVSALGVPWLIAFQLTFRGLPQTQTQTVHRHDVSFRDLFARPEVRRFVASRFIIDPVFYFYMFWIPQYLSQERGMSVMQIGSLAWIPFLVLGITHIVAGRASDALVACGWTTRRARLTLMLAGALVTPVSCLVVAARTPVFAIALMGVYMLAHGFWIGNLNALVGDTVSSDEVATTMGLCGTFGGISGMLTSLGIGWIVDHFSFTPVFAMAALLYPFAWLVVVTGRKTPAAGFGEPSRQQLRSAP